MVIHTLSVNPEVRPRHRRDDRHLRRPGHLRHPVQRPDRRRPRGLHRNGEYVLNPTASQLKSSKLDLVVAGTENAVLMVESEADQLTEDIMLGAVVFGHEQMQAVINAIHELVKDAGKPDWDWQPPAKDEALIAAVTSAAQEGLNAAYQIREKQARTTKLREVYADVSAKLNAAAAEKGEPAPDAVTVDNILFSLESAIVRGQILNGEPRIDGRDTRTVRPIERAHGRRAAARPTAPRCSPVAKPRRWSSPPWAPRVTRRSSTRSWASTASAFMLHYNIPPFATGETGRMGGPKRREIGHGRLAKRALLAAAADPGRLPVHHPRGFGNHRVQRFLVDGFGLRRLAGADGRRRAGQGAGRRYRHGPGQGRRQVRRADRHPG